MIQNHVFRPNAALHTWSQFRHTAAHKTQSSAQLLNFCPQLHTLYRPLSNAPPCLQPTFTRWTSGHLLPVNIQHSTICAHPTATYSFSPYSIPTHSADTIGAHEGRSDPGPNNILSTSHSVLTLLRQRTSHIGVMAFGPHLPTLATPMRWQAALPAPTTPPGAGSGRFWTRSQLYKLLNQLFALVSFCSNSFYTFKY